jgi:hypothetical protein
VLFDEMLDARFGSHEVMHIEVGDVAHAASETQPDNHHLFVARDVRGASVCVAPFVGSNPTVEDQYASRSDMCRETSDGRLQRGGLSYVTDAAEEAGNYVEAPAEVQLSHVSKVERHAGQLSPCDLEHRGAVVRSFDGIPLPKMS